MIQLGKNREDKIKVIQDYCTEHDIEKVVILTPPKFDIGKIGLVGSVKFCETVKYDEIIMYKFFYRLLQEINDKHLIVVNECMRTQNRNDLTYNCIRHYLNQTPHQIIFQYLPIIDTIEDFMILFDFDTKSQWKRERFNTELLKECTIHTEGVNLILNPINIECSPIIKAKYETEKDKLFKQVETELKDPHTIPRNLYLLSGKDKLLKVDRDKAYIGRNNRFKVEKMQTYKELNYNHSPYTVFELPHNYIDLTDFLCLSGQTELDVLSTDLKVDIWYGERYNEWLNRLKDAYSKIQ